MMKCVKIKEPRVLELSEMEDIKSKNGSVVIKIKSCGICGSDIHYWDLGTPNGLVMGHEFAGTVVDPGSRTDLKVGDRVTGLPISPCGKCEACRTGNPQYCRYTWSEAVGLSLTNPGGYAEYTACRPDLVRLLPSNVSYNEGSMVEPSAVSLHAVNLANIKVGQKVLIIGGGIIGLMAAEFARLNGAKYIAMLETNKARAKKAVRIGEVDEWFDALNPKTVEKVVGITKGGFDVVFDCCGNSPAVTEAIMTVKPGGTIVLVGVSMTPITIPTVAAVLGEVKMLGAIAYTEEEFDTCIDLINKKILVVDKYIDAKVPLKDANDSFIKLTSGDNDAIKIILKPEK